jgi:hypothetical protein
MCGFGFAASACFTNHSNSFVMNCVSRDGAKVHEWEYELCIEEPFQLFTAHLVRIKHKFKLQVGRRRRKTNRPKPRLPFGLLEPARQKVRRARAGVQRKSPRSCHSKSSSSSSSSSATPSSTSSSSSLRGPSSTSTSSVKSSCCSSDDDGPREFVEIVSEPAATFEGESEVAQAIAEDAAHRDTLQNLTSTFFGTVGIFDVGLATSGRSNCGVCSATILKNAPRFAYHWNRLRPSRWMHASCLPNWCAEDPNLQDQALQFLRAHTNQHSEQIQRVIEDALQALTTET